MEMIFMLVVVSVYCCVSSATQVYYITPNQGYCSVENETLKPCYTLPQFTDEDVLSSSKEHSIELVFLSGTHQTSNSRTLTISNFSEVIVRPFTEELEVMIECQFNMNSNVAGHLFFRDVMSLNLFSLRFTLCFVILTQGTNQGLNKFNISRCAFKESKDIVAVSISSKFGVNVNIFNCTFSSNGGGAVAIESTSMKNMLLINETVFQDNGNTFEKYTLEAEGTVLIVRNSQFINNTGNVIVSAFSSSMVLANTLFQKNYATDSEYDNSGILYLYNSNATISTCQFVNNSGSSAIWMKGGCDVPGSLISDSLFLENKNAVSNKGGAMYITDTAKLTIRNCNFYSNSAKLGGALYMEGKRGTLCQIQNSSFVLNEADQDGGAIYFDNFPNTEIEITGGNANSNYAEGNGGFLYLSSTIVSINTFDISNNTALNGGAMYAVQAYIEIYGAPEIKIDHNSVRECGGAFYLIDSHIFHSYLCNGPPLFFEHNAAVKKGGAIYILNQNCEVNSECFFLPICDCSNKTRYNFMNNTASEGPAIYGGFLDRCQNQQKNLKLQGIDYFKRISKFDPATPLAITSEPARVCLCTDDLQVNCSTREITLQVQRGQTIHLRGAVVDQASNPVQSFIRASYSELSAQLGQGESRRGADNKCSNLSYHIYTTSTSATLMLRPEGICENSNFSGISIHITVQPCPKGFESNSDRCECDKRLTKFNIATCNIDTYSIQRQTPIWIRYDQNYLKVHANCPLDYCNTSQDTISLNFPDEQCANHRSGVLCGACQDNYSIALGGSKCLQCTSNYTVIWLIPVFALAGIALVALLFVCNMTISHGTLNGLIFYANVVSITGLTSLQNCSIHPILSVFIAWVNLDLGVETCFYSGMDTYQKTWLQFAFPLYIWLLVGAVILASQYSTTAVKLFGRSSIAVLATLFLLSYSKILKTIITALNFTKVFQGSANDTSDKLVPYNVWAYDGNLEYLKGKHVPLFAVAMVFLVVLFLPYTLLLTFGQCLRSIPTERRYVPRCIRSTAFISIVDAYHAPYSKRHRYWTGLLLLTRCVLYLAFATSYTDNQLFSNMYITNIILMVILTLNVLKVLTSFLKNILEICFLLNLGLLSATLHYFKANSSDICNCTSASISVSIVLFGGIIVYHAYLQLKKIRCFASFLDRLQGKWHTRQYNALHEEDSAPVQRQPTSMIVQLREDLLESDGNI